MRNYALAFCTLFACGVPPAPLEEEPRPAELVIPVEYATNVELQPYQARGGGWETEVEYALGDDYPASLTITPPSSIYVIQGCSTPKGNATWTRLTNVQGTAATVLLNDGVLSVVLNEEGTLTAQLEGEATGLDCSSATTLAISHTLTLRVRSVAGFKIDQLHQGWPGCEQRVTVPADVPFWIPTAHLVDLGNRAYDAANAPRPVAITLRSPGALSRVTDRDWEMRAEPGHVELSFETLRPVEGLKAFDVIGPEALTTVQAGFFLRKSASKGSVVEEIDEGGSYQLFYPDQENLVDLRVTEAASTKGLLCMQVPGEWLAASSSTPSQCVASGGGQYGAGLPVAKIQGPGLCQLAVTIPNTTHRWATSFSTR